MNSMHGITFFLPLFSQKRLEVTDDLPMEFHRSDKSISINGPPRHWYSEMTRRTMLGLALVLAIVGAILFILGAIHPLSMVGCVPPSNGVCAPAFNYPLAYLGLAIVGGSVGVAFASSKLKRHITNHS